MPPARSRYFSYLLRLWQVKRDGGSAWRVSLDDPRTGERRGFASLTALMEFLKEQTQGERDKAKIQLAENE